MADSQRIDDLRRRVQKDPASIAFAQLAEECRRAGRYQEAVDVCDAGLALHPGYLSARVTLGRALIELNELEPALTELTTVLKSAPENLAAIRGVAEIHHRRNDLPAALAQYRAALALARNDPDLQRTVDELARQVEPLAPAAHADGLSFEQAASEFLKMAPAPARAAEDAKAEPAEDAKAASEPAEDAKGASEPAEDAKAEPAEVAEAAADASASFADNDPALASFADHDPALASFADNDPALASFADDPPREAPAAVRTIAVLEQWLEAIHVARAERGA